MDLPQASGKAIRMARLSRHRDGRCLLVPIDHSLSDGPVASAGRLYQLVNTVVAHGADAVVLHKGRVQSLPPDAFCGAALVVHLSASTAHNSDKDAKVLVGSAEDALRMGADAVSVHVNIGSATEARQLADLGAIASACDSWNLPLLAMIYPRGPRITEPRDVTLLSHVVNIAADLGADLVKTLCSLHPEQMSQVVESCPVPVLVAGGSGDTSEDDFLDTARVAINAGCGGLAVGRRVFGSADPGKFVRKLADIAHPELNSAIAMNA